MNPEKTWIYVAETGAVPHGEGRCVSLQGMEIGLFNTGKGFYAIDNRCPHKQGPLSDGILSGETVFCPLHNWNLDLKTGCALSGGTGQVKPYPVKVEGSKIFIALE